MQKPGYKLYQFNSKISALIYYISITPQEERSFRNMQFLNWVGIFVKEKLSR